jgi:hypothetical protein
MTFTEAAAQVLRLVGKPLHYKEITDVAIERDLLSHVGKSPEVTMGARLAALVKKGDKDTPLIRVKPGVFALREWDQQTISKGLADRTPALKRLEESEPDEPEGAEDDLEVDEAEAEADEEPVEARRAATANETYPLEEEELADLDADEKERAELAATATELFEAEEDDDEPILGGAEADEEREPGGGRRRRRRRRRRGGNGNGDDLPSYTVSEAPLDEVRVPEEAEERFRDRGDRERGADRGDRERGADRGDRDRGADRGDRDRGERDRGADRGDRDRGDRGGPSFDELSGEALADAVVGLLAPFERQGLVPLRQLAETAKRRGRMMADINAIQSDLAVSLRADNLRRAGQEQRPRFRFFANRVGLTDWLLDGELRRLERELSGAVERYRSAARRLLMRRLQELPPRAFMEFVLVVLERAGITQLEAVRRQGPSGGELHFVGRTSGPAAEVRTAVVVRRDGRDVGRERVTELRGTLHHYGAASAGWIITTGQVLSGAREEASAPGAAPVRLLDGQGFARLCEDIGVGVAQTRLRLPYPDGELFEALRSG